MLLVGDWLPNYGVIAPLRPVTFVRIASGGPVRPARYAQR